MSKQRKKTRVVRTVAALRRAVGTARAEGESVGLVPTMGALHEGHLSLIHRSVRRADFTVVSIFVNPKQFGPNEDFARYPRPLDRDLRLARDAGADLAFVPEVKTMYPEGFSTYVTVDGLTQRLCGAGRPGHFRGVTTVVAKLFNMVQPDFAFFGQKDAQQALVIRRMVRDMDMPLQIVVCPIVREADGLAMSSRNVYLTPEERSQAPVIHQALLAARRAVQDGEMVSEHLQNLIRRTIEKASVARIEYVEIVETELLQPVAFLKGEILMAVAVRFGRTRLIDNEIVRV